MSYESCVRQAVYEAKQHAQTYGIKIATIVAHPAFAPQYELLRIENGIAIVGEKLPNGKTSKQPVKFPLSELFDVSYFLRRYEARKAAEEAQLRKQQIEEDDFSDLDGYKIG